MEHDDSDTTQRIRSADITKAGEPDPDDTLVITSEDVRAAQG